MPSNSTDDPVVSGFWTPTKVLLLFVGLFLALLILLEAWLRITAPEVRWFNPRYMEISREFPDLDALVATQWYYQTRYQPEFLYASGPVTRDLVTFTDYFGARLTPSSVPLNQAEHIVWTFGGSTMENTETSDTLTIANTWAAELNRVLGPTHVKNFGTGGFFSSYQLIKFQRLLREVPQDELPGIAIFYDGYNDAVNGLQYGAGRLQLDLERKLEAVVEQRNLALLLLATSNALETVSMLWARTAAPVIQHVFFSLGDPDWGPDNLEATVRVYTSNVRMIEATCRTFGIECFFILQPMLPTKAGLTPVEQEALDWLEDHPRFGSDGTRFVRAFYRASADALADVAGFIDASWILNDRSDVADFYDVGHVGALSPPVIGERTAALILQRLGAAAAPRE
jgi:hypothetical protein